MNPKEKAENLVDKFRMVLMNEDTNCGCEILCTSIAKQNALIAVNEVIGANPHSNPFNTNVHMTMDYWLKVKIEIEKL